MREIKIGLEYKSEIPEMSKYGDYQIKCNKCDGKDVLWHTKSIIGTRFKENFVHFKYNRPEKSAIALHIHCIEIDHSFN